MMLVDSATLAKISSSALTRVVWCWLLAVIMLAAMTAQVDAASARPNIILILADDMGYGDLGCYGQSILTTPQLDRMCAEGLKFTQFYAGDTVCAPSRCVLLTGLHTGHCRVRGNSAGVMRPEDVTVAEVLQAAGYDTACIGKWGVGNPPPLDDPQRNGFDQFYGYISMYHAHNFYPEFLIRNGEHEKLRNIVMEQWQGEDGRGVASKKVDYAPDLLTDEVIKYLRQPHEKPFFVYYALNVPHANNEGGRFNPAPEKGMEVPSFGEYEDREWPGPEKGFAAMMRNIDRDVGRILDELLAHQLHRNTLVLFTSDNGPHQEGGHQMEFFNSNGELRGKKRDLYEGGIRVPCLAWWPETIAAGRVSHHLAAFEDFLPTFAELAGAEHPAERDGISFVPTLLEGDKQPEHEFLYWEFSEQGGKRAVRSSDWKLVQTNISKASPNAAELYNLTEDVAEAHDVAEMYPEVVQKLTNVADQAHRQSPEYPLFQAEQPQ